MAVIALGVVGFGGWRLFQKSVRDRELAGYIRSSAAFRAEYFRFYGQAPGQPVLERRFLHAASLADHGDMSGAAALLEGVRREAPLPLLFNDLGVLYGVLGDRDRALNALRDALARDMDYKPARETAHRWSDLLQDSADPLPVEAEPNDTNDYAEVVALGRPVEAEIAAGTADVDCYRVAAPRSPRDMVRVEIQNRCQTLIPRLRVFDGAGTLLVWNHDARAPGDSLAVTLTAPPNATLYLDIYGAEPTSGRYRLLVQALRAFDSYEPNDDIGHARRIRIGQIVEANIMDESDVDFYSFVSPRAGSFDIRISSGSGGLIPQVLFGPDAHSLESSPAPEAGDGGVHLRVEARAGVVYYVEIQGRDGTAGAYSLKIV